MGTDVVEETFVCPCPTTDATKNIADADIAAECAAICDIKDADNKSICNSEKEKKVAACKPCADCHEAGANNQAPAPSGNIMGPAPASSAPAPMSVSTVAPDAGANNQAPAPSGNIMGPAPAPSAPAPMSVSTVAPDAGANNQAPAP